MSSRETPIVCGVLIVVLIASAMADPPRNGEKVATPTTKPTTSRPSRLRNPDQMTAAEKRSAQSARYNLVKLKKIVQKKFLCQTCKGKGRLWVTLWAPARSGGLSHVDDENIVCDNCGGGKVFPSPGFHAALSEYNRAKLNFEQQYPLAEPLKTGLESWLFASIKNARTVAILNADAHSRLRAGAAKPDDIYLIGVQVFNVTQFKDRPAVQASLGPLLIEGNEEGNLIIFFEGDRVPSKLHDKSCLLVLAYNEGSTVYRTFFDKAMKARVLTAVDVKIVGRQVLPPE